MLEPKDPLISKTNKPWHRDFIKELLAHALWIIVTSFLL